ncbi:MAG TPA: sialidase family protein, partial [Kofleriaceae bacterium]
NDQEIAVGLTFGLLLSHDAGKTWVWICEDAFPYQGMYDPKYAYAASGALYATTFDGVKVMRDSCTFTPVADTKRFVTDVIAEPGGSSYYTAAEPGDTSATPPVPSDYQVYHSTDDGLTFPNPVTVPGMATWWQTIRAAPSLPATLYLTGYKYVPAADPKDKPVRQNVMYRSDNAGAAWTDLKIDAGKGVTLAPNSVIDVVGIASDDPKKVYIRVEVDDNVMSDSIYSSADSGATWTKLITQPVAILGFVVRAAKNPGGKHDLVLATEAMGTQVSHDDGKTWSGALAGAPHINCLSENTAGELWACTQNYSGVGGVQSDDAGVMKTADLETWTKVLRYQELTNAAACAADTVQAKTCAPMWCAVCAQLGCKAAASYNCPGGTEVPMVEPKSGGCCDAGSTGSGALALGVMIGTVLLRPRRRSKADHESRRP